jgi:sirohydrochlorin ferrochelatase
VSTDTEFIQVERADAPPKADGAAYAPKWAILAVVAVAQLMIVLDASVVNIALPHAQQAPHISDDSARQYGVHPHVRRVPPRRWPRR